MTLRRLAVGFARAALVRRIRNREIPQVIVHAALPRLRQRTVARTLQRSRLKLAWAGVGYMPAGRSAQTRRQLNALRVRRPLKAVVVSIALGPGPLADPAELGRLRPQAAEQLRALIDSLGVGRVTVVLDLPSLDDVVGEILAGAVESGRGLPDAVTVDPGMFDDLVSRIAAVPGVVGVRLEIDHGSNPRERARRILGPVADGVELFGPGRRSNDPAWTLGSLMAAAALADRLDPQERKRTFAALRSTIAAEPSRPPQALIPCVRRSPAGSKGCGTVGIRELHLHVGIQKTATTTIQAAMTSAREMLRQAGVVYVDRADMTRLGDIRGWGAHRATGGGSYAGFAAGLRAVVKRQQRLSEQAGLPSDVVFISNETLVGVIERGPFFERPFRPRAERALFEILDVLQPESCHLSMMVRRQDSLIESQYMWQLHGGESFGFARYLEAARRHPEALSYLNLAERLESLVGVDSLRVQPFESIHLDFGRFLNWLLHPMGVTVDFDTLVFESRANPAHSELGMQLARAINPHLGTKREVVKVREFLRDAYPVSDDHPAAALLDQASRADLLRMYAADNEEMFRRWMPQYPPDAYSRRDTVDALRGD